MSNNSNDILDSQGRGMNPFNGQPYSDNYKQNAKNSLSSWKATELFLVRTDTAHNPHPVEMSHA